MGLSLCDSDIQALLEETLKKEALHRKIRTLEKCPICRRPFNCIPT